ncbi:hypothetical protein RD792_005505 [Penstemon davidsonii]|uniref:Protein kinase domain-containing protein n=1 Tax=Penstemon davidsonii TaxID=160366 RepID=A0ABR0DEZ0_9LAMI|nr:hypothetical protein RD792_005505 [Penstemon davidsonii]
MSRGAHAATHPVRPRLKTPSPILIITFTLLSFSSIFVSAQENAAQSLLKFKSSLANSDPALANWKPNVPPCPPQGSQGNWLGVLCYNGYVWGLQLENMNLQGQIDVDSLINLQYLRGLSFMNNRFEGQMPDWRKLGALKSLYLSNNRFSGQIGDDAFRGMTSLKKVHLANNRFTGHIPSSVESPKLIELRLENNQFTGGIPAISSESLQAFNVSNNQLEGPIPAPLAKLDPSSFAGNRALCGQPLGSVCGPPVGPPDDLDPSLRPPSSPSPAGSNTPSTPNDTSPNSNKSRTTIIVLSVFLALSLIILLALMYRQSRKTPTPQLGRPITSSSYKESNKGAGPPSETMVSGAAVPKKPDQNQPGKLSFVNDDRQKFDLQDLMRASAEVLGSGNFGASYKAVLVDGEALVVKRFKQMNSVAREDFHEHMRRIGRLKHPNLLPLVAYLYRKEEKLLVFDYVYNGSLSTHLHGKHSEEQSGLSWPNRLKIVKGVAKGLVHLYNELPSLTVAHGHLKSSNVLLDKDFNPLLMDYTLVPVVNPSQVHQILVAYKSPEYAQTGRTSKKTDVWCLGILILEILTGKFVAKYLGQGSTPYGPDLAGWINGIVEDGTQAFDKEMKAENNCGSEMEKLLQIGKSCCLEDVEERWDLEKAAREIEQVQESSLSSTDHLGGF